MNPLKEAIALMTKEEVRAFKLHAQKVDMQAGRKDLELFDMIRKQGERFDDSDAFEKLYDGKQKNTFHRLKSRLLQDINRSMVDQHLERNDILRLWNFMSVFEFYLLRSHFELAHWFLRKADGLALKLGHFEALDIIYGAYIRLSHQVTDIDPEAYILKRRENAEELRLVRELDDLLAMAVYRTKIAQTWGEKGSELMSLLEKTVNEFGGKEKTALNPTTRIKLFQSLTSIFLDRRDYLTLEAYLLETYQQFLQDGVFTRNTHETKLRMLTYLANTLHKNGKFDASLHYAELLGREMKEFDGALQDRYLFFFYNALMINYFSIDLNKALALLEEMRANTKMMESLFHSLFVDMNIALVYYQLGQYKKAIKAIVQAQIGDPFKSADLGLRLHVCIAELMIRLKLEQYEVLEQRIRQVGHEFEEQLLQPDFQREAGLLTIFAGLNVSQQDRKDKKLQASIRRFIKQGATEQARDAEVINYDEFLKEYLVD